jgi:hypothetical protein
MVFVIFSLFRWVLTMMYNTWDFNLKKLNIFLKQIQFLICGVLQKVQKLSNPKDFVHYFLILVFKPNTYTIQHTPDTKACCMEKKLKECVRNKM